LRRGFDGSSRDDVGFEVAKIGEINL